jgi:lysyl-tRNA synthetase class I
MSLDDTHNHYPSIPLVLCPRCGTHMRLAQVTPREEGVQFIAYDCSCGFEYQMPMRSVKQER